MEVIRVYIDGVARIVYPGDTLTIITEGGEYITGTVVAGSYGRPVIVTDSSANRTVTNRDTVIEVISGGS